MPETPMPKFIHFQSNVSTIDTIVEYNGLYYKNGRLAFEPVPADAVLITPSKETLAALRDHQPAIHTRQQRWEHALLDQLCYEPDLTYGQWLSKWGRAVQAGRAREAADDDHGLYETRKAQADAWRAVEKQLAPHVAKERLNHLFGQLKLDTRVIGLAKRAFTESGDRNATVEVAQAANGDKVELLVDNLVGLRLCVTVWPHDLLGANYDADIVLVRPGEEVSAVDRQWDSSLGLFTVPFGSFNQLNGAKLRAL